MRIRLLPWHILSLTSLEPLHPSQIHTELSNHLIDSVLDEFFSGLDQWDFYAADPKEELRMFTSFFQVWKDSYL